MRPTTALSRKMIAWAEDDYSFGFFRPCARHRKQREERGLGQGTLSVVMRQQQELLDKGIKITGNSDYTIRYGQQATISTQLVIVGAKKKGMVSSGLPQLLGYMGSVTRARMADNKKKIGCFGAITDGEQFDFVILNELRQYSIITYRWKAGQKQQIWDSLNYIVAAAAGQSPQGANMSGLKVQANNL